MPGYCGFLSPASGSSVDPASCLQVWDMGSTQRLRVTGDEAPVRRMWGTSQGSRPTLGQPLRFWLFSNACCNDGGGSYPLQPTEKLPPVSAERRASALTISSPAKQNEHLPALLKRPRGSAACWVHRKATIHEGIPTTRDNGEILNGILDL